MNVLRSFHKVPSAVNRIMGANGQAMNSAKKYDYLVIGGGSAGIAGARRAAECGAKVALVEDHLLGGTCVNVGCVPKKIMFYAADYADKLKNCRSYGFDTSNTEFNWGHFKIARDDYVKRLNNIYLSNLKMSRVEVINGKAKLTETGEVQVDGVSISAKHVLIATGCSPRMPTDIPGFQHGINSDGFFALEEMPKNVVVVGAGYIATELAGVLKSLGSEVTMIIRQDKVLRQFDSLIAESVTENLERSGIKIMKKVEVVKVEKDETSQKMKVFTNSNATLTDVDVLLWAIGRTPNTDIGLENLPGMEMTKDGFIKADEYQNTTVPNVYAVGDVCGKAMLTPVAIAASRLLSDRIFNNDQHSKLDYTNIPSAIYTHPPAASVGMSQEAAESEYGKEKVKAYKSSFTPLHDSMLADKKKFLIKLVCLLPTEKILGLHMVGEGSDEILQGFSVAVKMGATKKDFDATVAIHPTSAEEVVLIK